MGSRSDKPEFDQSRFDNAQTGGDYYRQLAENELVPRIIERQRQALNVVPNFYRYYQRAYSGRRCSCFSETATSPSSSCLACFGTGNTSSYQLYGHHTEILDVTAASATVGIVPDFNNITYPVGFRLMDNVTKGYVDFTLSVKGGINVCSLVSLYANAPAGTAIRSGVKLFTEATFTDLSVDAVSSRLEAAQTTGGLHIRVVMERNSICAVSPTFQFVRVRYRTIEDDRVRGDVPLSSEANRSSDVGWFDEVENKTMYLDTTLRAISSEDLFRDVRSGQLWKVSETTPNEVGGLLTSWFITVRKVQDSERYASLV